MFEHLRRSFFELQKIVVALCKIDVCYLALCFGADEGYGLIELAFLYKNICPVDEVPGASLFSPGWVFAYILGLKIHIIADGLVVLQDEVAHQVMCHDCVIAVYQGKYEHEEKSRQKGLREIHHGGRCAVQNDEKEIHQQVRRSYSPCHANGDGRIDRA